MSSVIDILSKIDAPLRFSLKDSYKQLHLVRDLEKVMKEFMHQLRATINDSDIGYNHLEIAMGKIDEFEDTMVGFDSSPLDDKKKQIQRAVFLLDELKIITSSFHLVGAAVESIDAAYEKLSLPVQYVKGVGPKISNLLEKKGLRTIEDLLYFIPRRYEDRRIIKNISSTQIGQKETIVGKVVHGFMRFYGKKKVYEVTVDDGHGVLTARWFGGNQAYLQNTFKTGRHVIMTGEISGNLFRKDMNHPDYEILDSDECSANALHFRRIVPVYSETEGLYQKNIRRIMMEIIERYSKYLLSPIPEEICIKRGLGDVSSAIRNIHFPDFDEDIDSLNAMRSTAHRRLVYDEFFFFALGMALKRKGNMLEEGIAFRTGGDLLNSFYEILPFSITKAQKRVIQEIEEDMKKPFPMNRLLQGDVGSGKTLVAMATMVTACDNGYQAAMMAPTEILAEQHYAGIKHWAKKLGLYIAVLTGSMKKSKKREISEQILSGDIHIIIGTHALIQEEVTFKHLGLVVIDEQHRFGVVQRAALKRKGVNPDVLVMTATPIPRTLAMTVHGDLDISVIDEMPPGRKVVRTKALYEQNRYKAYDIARKELEKGNQVFIVYPLVEESETLDLKDATRMADHLQKEVFPDHRVGLIHGRMKGSEKDQIMNCFSKRAIHILVATTVIEVGIDIPHASLMIIEHAERFGLSQLHQLRGRVGRGDALSYCILMVHHDGSEDSRKRLRIMEKTNDGFRIAEEDLAIRGPGEFMGVRQSGLPDFRIANIIRDTQTLSEAKTDALSLVEKDPKLEHPKHRQMKEIVMRKWGRRFELAKIG